MTFLQWREPQNSPDSRHHIPRGAPAKSNEVSTTSVTDLGLDQTYPGYFDHCYCLPLWRICAFGTGHPLPPSSIPYHRKCKAKTYTSPKYWPTRICYMQTGSANEMYAFLRDLESKKRVRDHLLTVLILTRKDLGSDLPQPDASSYF